MDRSKIRGFALRDCIAMTLCAGLAGILLVPAAVGVETQSRLQVCVSRLKRIGDTREMYAGDNAGRFGTLRSVVGPVQWQSLGARTYANTTAHELQSTADQAIDIIRRRGGRDDMQAIEGWLSLPFYNTLALADYLGESLPSPNYACPEDSNLLAWQSDPRNFNNLGVPSPVDAGPLSNANKRWPYISSYMSGPSDWSNDVHTNEAGAFHFLYSNLYQRLGGVTPGRGDLGHRQTSEVVSPSRKIAFWDRGSRHFTSSAVYWNFANAKQPVLFYDGVVRTVRTGATAPGWDWNLPNRPDRTHMYTVDFRGRDMSWQPGRPAGDDRPTVLFTAAHFATTRNGLAGVDLP